MECMFENLQQASGMWRIWRSRNWWKTWHFQQEVPGYICTITVKAVCSFACSFQILPSNLNHSMLRYRLQSWDPKRLEESQTKIRQASRLKTVSYYCAFDISVENINSSDTFIVPSNLVKKNKRKRDLLQTRPTTQACENNTRGLQWRRDRLRSGWERTKQKHPNLCGPISWVA